MSISINSFLKKFGFELNYTVCGVKQCVSSETQRRTSVRLYTTAITALIVRHCAVRSHPATVSQNHAVHRV
jgi:hypothetical protein